MMPESMLLTRFRASLRQSVDVLPPFTEKASHATLLLRNIMLEKGMGAEDMVAYLTESCSMESATPRLIVLKKLNRLLGYAVQLEVLDAAILKIDPDSSTSINLLRFVNNLLRLPAMRKADSSRGYCPSLHAPTRGQTGGHATTGAEAQMVNDIYPGTTASQASQIDHLLERNKNSAPGIVATRLSRRRKLGESMSTAPTEQPIHEKAPCIDVLPPVALARAAHKLWKYTKYNVRTAAYLNYNQQQLRTHSTITLVNPSTSTLADAMCSGSPLSPRSSTSSQGSAPSSPTFSRLKTTADWEELKIPGSGQCGHRQIAWETTCYSCFGVGLAQVSGGRLAAGFSPLPTWAQLPLLALQKSISNRGTTLLQGFNALDADGDALLSINEFCEAFRPAALQGEWWEARNMDRSANSCTSLVTQEHAHAIFGLADLDAHRHLDFSALASLMHRAKATAIPAGGGGASTPPCL
jgi:hypothetical protein